MLSSRLVVFTPLIQFVLHRRTYPHRRYLRDFEEEGLIARGSFGDVYRTRHRLDGTR